MKIELLDKENSLVESREVPYPNTCKAYLNTTASVEIANLLKLSRPNESILITILNRRAKGEGKKLPP